MRSRIAILLVVSLAIVAPAQASFRTMANAIDAHLGHRTYIPFLGLARFALWVVSPKGVHDFQLAVWEGKSRGIEGEDLVRIVNRGMDQGFTPLVRVRSLKKGENVFVYAKPLRGDVIELLILTHERDDTVLVRVVADAAIVARDFGHHPRHVIRLGQH